MGDRAHEFVDWVDEFDDVIEVVTRDRMRRENLRHRSVSIVVLSTDGRLLAHRRADRKDLHPGWWDICVGGVVTAGETYDSAAPRELAEEIGVVAARLDRLGTGRWDDDDSREISALYLTVHDGPFTFDDGEVAEARFVTPHQLAELRATRSFLPGSLAILLPHLPRFSGDPAPDHTRLTS